MKVAVITGVTSGLGLEFLKIIISEHPELDEIWAIARRKDRLKDIEEKYNKIIPISLDLCDKDSISVFVRKLELEKPDIRVLINNAGITSNVSLLDSTDEEFREMFDINFFGVVSLTREVVKHMKETGGSIINTSSMVGTYGGRNQSAYASSKFAINGLTKSLAKELGIYNIRVNAVAPGVVETDMMSIELAKYIRDREK